MAIELHASTVQGWLAVAGGLVAVTAFAMARRDAARAQAARVFVFASRWNYGWHRDAPPEAGEGNFTVAMIHNDSDAPLFDVGLEAWSWGRRRHAWRLRRHRDWMTAPLLTGRLYSVVTARAQIEDDTLPPAPSPEGDEDRGQQPPLMLRFRDCNGRSWVRWPDAKLTREKPCRAS